MIGLANKDSGYDLADQETVEALSVVSVEALHRKRTEQERAELLARQRALLENVPAAIFLKDIEGRYVAVNPAYHSILPESVEDPIAKCDRDFFPEGIAKGLEIEDHKVMVRGQTIRKDMPIEFRDGSAHHVIMSLAPVRTFGGDITGMVGTIFDITEQKRAEDALRQANRFQQQLLDTAATAIFTVDTQRRISGVNEEFCSITGFTKDDIIGEHCDILNSYPCTNGCGMFDPRKEAQIFKKRCSIKAKDGRRLTILKNAALFHDNSGQVIGGMESFVDVTELIEAREAAEAANKAKSEFLANMSHEIRTPMNGIIGMAGIALETKLTPEQRSCLEIVKASADSLLTVINDILDFSKIEAGKLDLESIEFNLRDSIGDMLNTLALRAYKKGLELAYDVLPNAPDALVGDPGRLQQIIINLVENAAKFTEQGEVVVRVEPAPGPALERSEVGAEGARPQDEVCLKFSVSDTGIGISAEKQTEIFDVFAQADASATRKYGGTGLGLAISRQLVEMMGGRISVDSEPGRGSTFHFTARFGLQKGATSAPVPIGLANLKNLPVLVVDDNATSRRILEKMLLNWDMRPTTADSGWAALRAVQRASESEKSFALMLLDAHLPVSPAGTGRPEMDGFTLAKRIRESSDIAGATIMILSPASERDDVARCRELGITAYLTKPVKEADLANAVVTALGLSAREAQDDADGLPTPNDHPRRSAKRPLHILLAEDNMVNQKLAVHLLEKRGHTVAVVSNGREALEALDKERFDLVLMDVQMPEMNGFDATASIRSKETVAGAHIPIVAMTAHAMKGDRERCLNAGMDDYVSKPIQAALLFETIERSVAASLDAETPASRDGDTSVCETLADEVFDIPAALANVCGEMEILREAAGIFLDEFPQLIAEIRRSVARGDCEMIQRAAHKLKGSVGIFCAKAAFDAALSLEMIGRDGDVTNADETWARLEKEIERLKPALAAIGDESPCAVPAH